MVFDLFDLIAIIAGIFYYMVMGFGFVGGANIISGCKFSPIDLVAVALWPFYMFFMTLSELLNKEIK